MHRLRRLLWRKLTKVDSKLKMASTMHKKSKLLAEKWKLERQLAEDYTATNNAEEDEVVLRMKENPKAFFSFARSRQTTRAKVGPFLDPVSNQPIHHQTTAVRLYKNSMKVSLPIHDQSGRLKTLLITFRLKMT